MQWKVFSPLYLLSSKLHLQRAEMPFALVFRQGLSAFMRSRKQGVKTTIHFSFDIAYGGIVVRNSRVLVKCTQKNTP